jgi:hypothetical protein
VANNTVGGSQRATIWEIWYGGDRLMFDALPTTRYGIVMLIWTQICQYFFIGWDGYKEKILAGKMTQARAWFLFTRDYGQAECLFYLEDDILRVLYTPFGVL